MDTDVSSLKSNSLRNACHPERSREVCDDADDPKDYYNGPIGQLSPYHRISLIAWINKAKSLKSNLVLENINT